MHTCIFMETVSEPSEPLDDKIEQPYQSGPLMDALAYDIDGEALLQVNPNTSGQYQDYLGQSGVESRSESPVAPLASLATEENSSIEGAAFEEGTDLHAADLDSSPTGQEEEGSVELGAEPWSEVLVASPSPFSTSSSPSIADDEVADDEIDSQQADVEHTTTNESGHLAIPTQPSPRRRGRPRKNPFPDLAPVARLEDSSVDYNEGVKKTTVSFYSKDQDRVDYILDTLRAVRRHRGGFSDAIKIALRLCPEDPAAIARAWDDVRSADRRTQRPKR